MICNVCNTSKEDPLRLGKFYKSGQLTVHYFCVLLSDGLPQRGKDTQGILGFLGKDIMKMILANKNSKCVFCKKGGATLKCNKCTKIYHLPCVLRNGGCSIFQPLFVSLCNVHYKPTLPKPKVNYNWMCIICLEKVRRFDFFNKNKRVLVAPCCHINLLHNTCAMELAMNCAYYTRCPMCQNTTKFQNYLNTNGVFIEHRDSFWTNENMNPAPQGNIFTQCNAVECLCPKGRNFILLNDKNYDLVACFYCGADAVHFKCKGKEMEHFVCPLCQEVEKRFETFSKLENTPKLPDTRDVVSSLQDVSLDNWKSSPQGLSLHHAMSLRNRMSSDSSLHEVFLRHEVSSQHEVSSHNKVSSCRAVSSDREVSSHREVYSHHEASSHCEISSHHAVSSHRGVSSFHEKSSHNEIFSNHEVSSHPGVSSPHQVSSHSAFNTDSPSTRSTSSGYLSAISEDTDGSSLHDRFNNVLQEISSNSAEKPNSRYSFRINVRNNNAVNYREFKVYQPNKRRSLNMKKSKRRADLNKLQECTMVRRMTMH